jgi:hypothetical protein
MNSNSSRLEIFKLDFVLKNGAKLLSSDTHKYEIKESDLANPTKIPDSPNTDLKENIKKQRQLLVSKLGIDVGGAANLDTTHLFTDEDLLMSNTHTSNSSPQSKASPVTKRKLDSSFGDFKEEVSFANSSC